MILITCTNETRPADFLMLAQNPVTYELLGFSATGTEYTGDFSGFECRIGTSNELGDYSGDEINPTYSAPTNASVRVKFNAWQSSQRAKAYKEELDKLTLEAAIMDFDPKENAQDRQSKKNEAVAIRDAIKARYPKV